MNKLAVQGEKTFGSFGDRFAKGDENLNTIAVNLIIKLRLINKKILFCCHQQRYQ